MREVPACTDRGPSAPTTIPDVKVVVIGGGVIGYSVAHALAARDADVLVIDMRGPGRGATQASAGMLAPYIEGHDERLLQLGVRSLSLYDDFIRALDSDAGQVTEYCRAGTLQVARSSAHVDELGRAARRLSADNVPHSLLTADQVRVLEPALATDFVRGLLVPVHGYVHVGQLMSALTRASSKRGVTALVDRVTGIEPSPEGVQVNTEGTSISASAVVVAAGSWCGQLTMPESRSIPVRPIRGQSIEIGFSTRPLSHVVWGEDCYLVPWKNGSVIVGATVEDVGFNESSTPEGIASLVARGQAVLPSVAGADVAGVRVGLRPATTDELPLIGWSSTMRRVCVATGHYRNGILLAPLTARLVADMIFASEDPDTQWMRDAVAPSRMGL